MIQILLGAATTVSAALGVAMLVLMAALPLFSEWQPPQER